MNELLKFEFQNNESLECVELDGEPLFNPFSVGKCLEIVDGSVKNTLTHMDSEDIVDLKSENIKNHVTFNVTEDSPRLWLRESGLYLFIFKSRKKEAKAFKKWVAREVLPSIRRTGKYNLSKTDTMEINSSLNALQQHNIVNPYEVATANNQSYRAKLSNLINDIAKRDHRKPGALYNELYYAFAAKAGVYIPEQADLEGKSPSRYLKKPDKAVLSENLYLFAVNYFYQGKSVFELINLDPGQKTLGEF